MKFFRFTCLFALLLAMSQAVLSAGLGRDEAQDMVKKAIESYKTNGKEKLVAAVNTPKGPYDKGDLYVFLYDMKGTMVAHPTNPHLVGKNNYEIPDATGKLFRKEMIDKAKDGKSGWIEYKLKNPANGTLQTKVAYYEPVGDLIAVASFYKQ